MSWTDEDIDKLFQESAGQVNVPYQDSFWTEMEALLPQKEKKKGLGWIFGGTLTCVGLVIAMVFPVNQFSVQTAKKQHASGNPSNAGNSNMTNSNQLAMTAEVIPTDFQALLVEQPPHTPAENANNDVATQGLKPQAFRLVQTKQRSPLKPDNMSALSPFAEIALAENTIATETNENQQEIAAETTRLPLLEIPTSTQELVGNKYAAFKPRVKTQKFYAQVGFGISQSHLSGTDKNWMPAVNLGAGYQYRPQGFGFSAGLNINSSFSNTLEITRRSKIYNFSSTNYEQSLSYKQLYTVELPVSLDFRANKHVFSVGIAPTYLASTVMRFSQAENGAIEQKGNYIGQRVGLKSFGLKPSISYQMEVSNSWYVGIQLNAQVINQIDQLQFVEKATRFPLSGQITLRKTLSK